MKILKIRFSIQWQILYKKYNFIKKIIKIFEIFSQFSKLHCMKMLFENEVSGMFETLTKYIFCDLMMFKYFLEGCECSNQSKKAMSVEKLI